MATLIGIATGMVWPPSLHPQAWLPQLLLSGSGTGAASAGEAAGAWDGIVCASDGGEDRDGVFMP
jgi:hypothetical protein